jgi:hypothetical protein
MTALQPKSTNKLTILQPNYGQIEYAAKSLQKHSTLLIHATEGTGSAEAAAGRVMQ